MLNSLKIAAGPRDLTFLGRAVQRHESLSDILARFPAAEIEEAGSAIRGVTDPVSWTVAVGRPVDAAAIRMVLGMDPLVMPGIFLKYMRQKLQSYLDPDEELMQARRDRHVTIWQHLRLLGYLIAENLGGVHERHRNKEFDDLIAASRARQAPTAR